MAIRLDVNVDVDQTLAQLANLGPAVRRGVAQGIDRLANTVQRDVRAGVAGRFTIAPARQTFMRNLVKRNRDDRATPAKLEAVVRIEGPQTARERASVLTRHEDGGSRTSTAPLFFIPTKELRPTNVTLPPRSMYPKALRLMDARGIGGATASTLAGGRKGKRRKIAGVSASLGTLRKVGLGGTFLVQYPNGSGAIFQRQGEGREGLVRLWHLVPQVRLPARLRFYATAERTIDAEWRAHVEAAVRAAVARL